MLRTNRGDKFSLAYGPERVVKRAQPWLLAEQFQVLQATSISPLSRHRPGLGALRCISLGQYVDMLRYDADRLAVVCALDRRVFQYRQASIAILNSWVAQSADLLQAGRSPCVSFPPPCWPSTLANGLRN